MQLSEINKLFSQEISLNVFKKSIESEVSEYKQSLIKKGSSSPIILNEDIETLVLSESNVKFLCDAFLQSLIDKWEINYLVEGLLLTEKVSFENEKVKNAFFSFADPEYYELIDEEYVRDILEDFGN